MISVSGDKEKISYCEDCLKVKVLSVLRHRIYLNDRGEITNPGPDSSKWKQCWTCGLIVGVYEAKQEVELDTLTSPRENPFKFGGGSQVMAGESRKVDRSGKTQRKRKLNQDLSDTRGGCERRNKERENGNLVCRTTGLGNGLRVTRKTSSSYILKYSKPQITKSINANKIKRNPHRSGNISWNHNNCWWSSLYI